MKGMYDEALVEMYCDTSRRSTEYSGTEGHLDATLKPCIWH